MLVTNYSMLNDQVSRYLPNKVESLELHDVSLAVAEEYVLNRLKEDNIKVNGEPKEAIAVCVLLAYVPYAFGL